MGPVSGAREHKSPGPTPPELQGHVISFHKQQWGVEAPRGKVERDTGKNVERRRRRCWPRGLRVHAWQGGLGCGGVPRAALPGVLLEMRELAEGFLTEVTTVGLGP